MTNYSNQARKTANKIENNSRIDDLRKGVASMAGSAQSFIRDTKDHVGEVACESTKYIKDESIKNLKKAEGYVKAHPRKSTMMALGLGAVASYFMLRRK